MTHCAMSEAVASFNSSCCPRFFRTVSLPTQLTLTLLLLLSTQQDKCLLQVTKSMHKRQSLVYTFCTVLFQSIGDCPLRTLFFSSLFLLGSLFCIRKMVKRLRISKCFDPPIIGVKGFQNYPDSSRLSVTSDSYFQVLANRLKKSEFHFKKTPFFCVTSKEKWRNHFRNFENRSKNPDEYQFKKIVSQ